ncbi:MAG: SGNH/GDSL hydrolase family protein [Selenomonadaceae bacterium]|nr:SGNH/GDSL hydrolase family protein [Selenomonadaceae bacterium]
MKKIALLLTFFLFLLLTAVTTLADDSTPPAPPTVEPEIEQISEPTVEQAAGIRTIVRLSWKLVPGAVRYKVSFDNEVSTTYINGIELEVDNVSKVFHVAALDINGRIIKPDIDVTQIETNPIAPRPTTEFEKMDYGPLYPVYSWIPTFGADYYQIQVFKNDELVRSYEAFKSGNDDAYDFYDEYPVNEGGDYYWRVRAMSHHGFAMSEWSERTDNVSFKVTSPNKVCALGDSITHGGGAVTVPPSMTIYNWETYCDVPVKNLGKSGDTTDVIVERFENDVLPFEPKVLIIMAGVNDYRGTIFGWHSVSNYRALVDKCNYYGITPVFITPTPVNAKLIKKSKFIELPPYDWQTHYQFLCDWIRKQPYHIDLTSAFEDDSSELRADLTSDGLHPDEEGKRIIGHAVEEWLKANEALWNY